MNHIKISYKFKYGEIFDNEVICLSDCAKCGKMATINIYEFDDFGACSHKIQATIGCKCFSIKETDLIDRHKSMTECAKFIEEFIVKIKECVLEWNMINNNPLKIEFANRTNHLIPDMETNP